MFKIIISLVFLPALVWATPDETQQLKEIIQRYESSCPRDNCEAPFTTTALYSRATRVRVPEYDSIFHERVRVAAYSQAQIWGDTILEGDYYAAGHTRVDAVVAIHDGQTLVAYKILYSEKSWDTSTCPYDGHRRSLEGCTVGRIIESSYALPDFKTLETDQQDYAEFEPGATAAR